MRISQLITFIIVASGFACYGPAQHPVQPPNIVVIMADDMGYGDIQALNAESKIPTSTLNRLATEGVLFTDAHSPSAVCTPTRYGLLCGRYCWRTKLKNGVLGGYSKPLIAGGQPTIGTVLQSAGYTTACIGKWHLGLGWQWKDALPENINFFGVAGEPGSVDYSKPVTDGPTRHGFDYAYIIPASLDMSPYVYLEKDRVTAIPSRLIPGESFPAFYRQGEIADDFEIIDCLNQLTEKATQFIKKQATTEQPFFLYLALSSPHKPVMPSKNFQGKSRLGPYGDFILQVDSAVGTVLSAINDAGIRDNTCVIFTSDNGSFMKHLDDGQPDHVDDPAKQGYRADSHRPNGVLRGTKADIWEAGHRVPFIVRWPGQVPAGKQCAVTITHTDLLATLAEVANTGFPREKCEDSYSFLAYAKNPTAQPTRPPVIHHSSAGMFAIRDGKWKLVLGNGSGGREQPTGKPFEKPYHLFDMSHDFEEKENLIDSQPQLVAELVAKFEAIAADALSQANQPPTPAK